MNKKFTVPTIKTVYEVKEDLRPANPMLVESVLFAHAQKAHAKHLVEVRDAIDAENATRKPNQVIVHPKELTDRLAHYHPEMLKS